MAQTIKVEISGAKGLVIKEVTFQEAESIMKEAYIQGSLVIDKRTGQIIKELDTDIKEMWVTDIIAGG